MSESSSDGDHDSGIEPAAGGAAGDLSPLYDQEDSAGMMRKRRTRFEKENLEKLRTTRDGDRIDRNRTYSSLL